MLEWGLPDRIIWAVSQSSTDISADTAFLNNIHVDNGEEFFLAAHTRKRPNLGRVAGMLAHTEIASSNPEATRKFIEKVFEWDLEKVKTPSGERIRYQTPGGAQGSIRGLRPKEVPRTINYILVDDIEATAKKIKRARGEIVMPIVDVPKMGRFFWFRVPGGPILAAWQDASKDG